MIPNFNQFVFLEEALNIEEPKMTPAEKAEKEDIETVDTEDVKQAEEELNDPTTEDTLPYLLFSALLMA